MTFLNPQVFFILLILIPIIFFSYVSENKNNKILDSFISNKILEKLSISSRHKNNLLFYIIRSLSFLFLIIAIARPVGNQIKTEVENKGRDIIIAIDISNSMRAKDVILSGSYSDTSSTEDIKDVSRFEATKKVLNYLLKKEKNDRFSLIAFSDIAFPLLPFTEDKDLLSSYINNLDFSYTSFGGTDLSKPIEVGIKRLKNKENKKNKNVMILFSDGEEHNNRAEKAAEKAKEAGLTIITVGLGSEQGAKIPMGQDPMGNTYYQTHHAREVISKLNDLSLKKIARITKGKYLFLDNTDIVSKLSYEIEKIEKSSYKALDYYEYEEWFSIFAFISLLLFILPVFRRSI